MNAATRNQKTMTALGIVRVEWQRNEGRTAIWHVTRDNGDVLTIRIHHFSTDTGVLREAAKIIGAARY